STPNPKSSSVELRRGGPGHDSPEQQREVPLSHARGLPLVALAALVLAGCGGSDSQGATVSVYVAAPLCAGAKQELASHGATAGHFTVAVRCLAPSETSGGGVDLATDG